MSHPSDGLIFYVISDSIGETAQKNLSAAIAQFPDVSINEIKRFPFVENMTQLSEILEQAKLDKGIVLVTLVCPKFIAFVSNYCNENHLKYIDYLSPLLGLIEEKTNIKPIQTPGVLHQLNKEYFDRVEAIEFAVKYDDGKDPRGFHTADIVLIGVSRTSKTPLSMYLANQNYKVANLPLVPEAPLPKELFEIDPRKIIGLTTNIDVLLRVRKTRLKAFGLKEESSYTSVQRVTEELGFAEEVFSQLGLVPINVHDKAIEETAMLIEIQQKKINARR